MLLSNWVFTAATWRGEKEVVPSPTNQQECWNSKTLNNSHPKLLRISLTNTRWQPGTSTAPPHSFTAPRLGVPYKRRPWKDLPALHLSSTWFQQPILPSGKGTRTHSIAAVAPELYRPVCKWQIIWHSPHMRLYNSQSIPNSKTKRFQNGNQMSWMVVTCFDKRQFDASNFQATKQWAMCQPHLLRYDLDTNPPQHLPRLPNTTRAGANSRSFVPTLKAIRSSQHPGDVIRWYLSSHTRSWSIGQWPVPTQATGSDQWECS